MNRPVRTDPAADAMIDAEVAAALRPYEAEGYYTAEELDELRHMMRIVLRTHPTATHLLAQLGPHAAPDESGKEDVRAFNGALTRVKRAEGE
jgi:hypothetical protein